MNSNDFYNLPKGKLTQQSIDIGYAVLVNQESRKEVAERYGVSVAWVGGTIKRLLKDKVLMAIPRNKVKKVERILG